MIMRAQSRHACARSRSRGACARMDGHRGPEDRSPPRPKLAHCGSLPVYQETTRARKQGGEFPSWVLKSAALDRWPKSIRYPEGAQSECFALFASTTVQLYDLAYEFQKYAVPLDAYIWCIACIREVAAIAQGNNKTHRGTRYANAEAHESSPCV